MKKQLFHVFVLAIILFAFQFSNAQSANFTVSDTTVCSGTSATFTDQSTGSPVSWNWTFSGGTPGKSTSQDPVITYTVAGIYSVKLVVTYASGMDSITKTGYIRVIQTPHIDADNSEAQCDPAVFTISASASAGYVTWYAATTGGLPLDTGNSFTTPFLYVYTSYWVDATYDGCTTPTREEVAAEVQLPTITATTPASECSPGSLTLRASVSDGASGTVIIYWYADSTGGTSLGSGTSFNTGPISTSTTYYVEGYYYGCTSLSRTPVVATVYSGSPLSITGITPDSICGPGSATLAASSNSGTIYWYTDSTGGVPIDSGSSFTTPTISSSTNYYAGAADGCGDTTGRVAITAIVDTVPYITAAIPGSECGPGSVTLEATASAGTVNWYADSTGGSYIDTGSLFATPSISATTIYYADASYEGCTSTERTPVPAILNDTLTPPVLTNTDSVICSYDSTRIQTNENYSFYRWSNGDTLPYTYANVAGGYWVTVSDANGCSAVSGHVNISVYSVSSVSVVVQGDTLSSFNSNAYQWYFNDSILEGATDSIYVAHKSGDYAVQVIDSNGCTALSNSVPIALTGVTNLNGLNDILIWSNGNIVNVDFTMINDVNANIEIRNVLGQLLIEDIYTASSVYRKQIDNLQAGYILVSVKNKDQLVSKTVFVTSSK